MKVEIGPYPDERALGRPTRVEFIPEDMWCLASSLATVIAPALREFAKVSHGYPGNLTEEAWADSLALMAEAFEAILEDNASWNWSKKKGKRVAKGLRLFSSYYLALWD